MEDGGGMIQSVRYLVLFSIRGTAMRAGDREEGKKPFTPVEIGREAMSRIYCSSVLGSAMWRLGGTEEELPEMLAGPLTPAWFAVLTPS